MTADYNFTVTNTKDGKTAETSFKYDVIVTFPEALPEGISITVDGKIGTASSDRKKVTIKDVGRFAAGNSQTHDHTLVFSVVNEAFLLRDYVFLLIQAFRCEPSRFVKQTEKVYEKLHEKNST